MLKNVSVLELSSSIKGAYCGWLFAQAGAQVSHLPYHPDRFEPKVATWLATRKQPVELPPKAYLEEAAFEEVAADADAIVVDVSPATEPHLYARIEAYARSTAAESQVVINLADISHDRRWDAGEPGDLVVSAMSGMMSLNMSQTSPPLREPGNQTQLVAGLSAFFGGLSSLLMRARTTETTPVAVSALESMVTILAPQVLQQGYQGPKPPRTDDGRGYLFPCKDGWVSIVIVSETAWNTVTALWNITGWESDERLNSEVQRRKNMDYIREILAPHLNARTRLEIFSELAPVRVVCGYVASPAGLLEDPHLVERKAFQTTEEGLSVPNLPIRVVASYE